MCEYSGGCHLHVSLFSATCSSTGLVAFPTPAEQHRLQDLAAGQMSSLLDKSREHKAVIASFSEQHIHGSLGDSLEPLALSEAYMHALRYVPHAYQCCPYSAMA